MTNAKSKIPGRRLAVALTALVTALAGCASTTDQVYEASIPKAEPQRSATSFSDSLACMDDLLYAYGIRDIRITTNGIPDATGEIQAGTRDMLISAVSRMSTRSRAFTYIDFEEVNDGFGPAPDQRLYQLQQKILTPTYYIRGAITSFDDSVISETAGGGLRVGGTGAGINIDKTSSVVGLDMNVGEVKTGLIVPGVVSSNRIAVSRRGIGADASFDVELQGEVVGGYLQASRSRSEGMHTAVRTLVELNAIETLGKLTRVPYWRCVGIDQTDPAAQKEAGQYYRSMTDEERLLFVQRSLKGMRLYNGPVDGRGNAMLTEAVGRYQSRNGLVASGQIDRQLYASLLGRDIALAGDSGPARGSGLEFDDLTRKQLFISLTDALEFPTFMVGMPLQAVLRLNDDAFVYCFYQDGKGRVARIYPNRFQASPVVRGGMALKIPNDEAGFRIIFEEAGAKEYVSCFASRTQFGSALPEALRAADLTPLPVRSLREVEQAIRAVAPDDLAVTTREFLIR